MYKAIAKHLIVWTKKLLFRLVLYADNNQYAWSDDVRFLLSKQKEWLYGNEQGIGSELCVEKLDRI